MQCKSCGAETPEEAGFCPKCGAKLVDEARASESETSPAERLRNSAPGDADADGDEEQDLWEGGYSGKAMIGSWIGAGLATLVAVILVIALGWGTYGWLGVLIGAVLVWGGLALTLASRKLSVHYILTSQRFIHRTGILKRVTDRIEMIDIDDVTFAQGIVQRMVGVGTIHISSSDRTHPELLLLGIDDVKNVADTIDDVRRQERRKRGLHIESI